ncbi:hypothetical protein K458DRAFT_391851 [Lentithecium fluviatile CBS 122367]|uniref:Uncharacterized protein n=1 Tax=Lentithecium fluviatile CBS 122367 TaxID=1168545 RepID=A0A6G1ITH6_9PLEO|nr:hypothetical protein K458DRAFT_391851 [Lentithecium fluviatile CBS 122367]
MASSPMTLLSDPIIRANILDTSRSILKSADEFVDRCYKDIDDFEKRYRKLGVTYHSTQLGARNPRLFDTTETITAFKNAFEITTVEQYHAFFAPVAKFLNLFNEIRNEIWQTDLPEEILRHVDAFTPLKHRIKEEQQKLEGMIQTLRVHVHKVRECDYRVLEEPGEIEDPRHNRPLRPNGE